MTPQVQSNAAALEFLEKWCPGGPWTLTAVNPDKKGIDTQTFRDPASANAWLTRHNGNWNIYFAVNPLLRDMTKKAAKEDVRELAWLHVDIDPRPGEDLKEEQARALTLLTTKLPPSIPPPTCIIFSGGGYQAFWKIFPPFEINGDVKLAEEAERYNRALEQLSGGDHCHNVDRIMRLPGTWNIPNAKKQAKGRKKVEAELHDWQNDRVYEVDQFQKAPPKEGFEENDGAPSLLGEAGFRVTGSSSLDSSNGARGIVDLAELSQWNVDDRYLVIIERGRFPDEKKAGDDSRSAWLFDAVCHMVRHSVPDAAIFSVLMNPAWEISGSVLEQRSHAERYARRQIERAHAANPSAELIAATAKMNPDDVGNAQRFGLIVGQHVRYSFERKRWLIWDGTRWTEDSTGEVMRWARCVGEVVYKSLPLITDERDLKKHTANWHRLRSEKGLASMIALARSEPGIPILQAQFDQDPWLLNVENGTLDLRTRALRQHRREDMITKLAPVNYNPEAQCPTWDRFLLEVMGGDQSKVDFLKRSLGYSLTGIVCERVFFTFHGVGRNGKSTFLEVARALLGDYAGTTSSETILERPSGERISNDLAKLNGLRFVTAVETEPGRRLAEGRIKAITGGDTITARFLHQEFFDFAPTFKVFLATNSKPEIRGTDDAIWDRVCLIPFDVRITEDQVDKDLRTKLLAELPGILRWAVEGCGEWSTDGLGPPEGVQGATQAYREESDPVSAFIADQCVLDPTKSTTTAELHSSYSAWAIGNGERNLSPKGLASRLRKIPGLEPTERVNRSGSDKTARGFRGIGEVV